ncbi:MAG TPA: DUF5678 domain-containing protein [Candidatus Nanoarchaeia archaeon]|nr:DUF5678 domain-containing protein [Candidatus Nanoarchaeia archaeon]
MVTNIELITETEENIDWFNENYPQLQQKYAGTLIAIKNKTVVGIAKNAIDLLNALKEKSIDETEVLIEIIPPSNEITIF